MMLRMSTLSSVQAGDWLMRKRLQTEEKRQAEDLEAALLDGDGRLAFVARAAAPSARRQRNAHAGQKEEQRRAEAAENQRAPERRGPAIGERASSCR